MISVVDSAARHVHKTVRHRQDGFKAHLAIEPDIGLFTAAGLTEAAGEDNHEAVVGLWLLYNDTELGEFEVLGDTAYGTGDARAAPLADAGHTAIIKPAPLRPAVVGGFTVDDFTFDETGRDWATNPNLQASYRPMVERSIAWLIGPKGRCHKLRYRGVAANDWWLHTRMAALNLRRLINLGLHRRRGTWALA